MDNYCYDAFGNEQNITNDNNPFRYAGEYYDQETGLIYLRNRYYNSSTGRFITEDPAQDGVNWYSYCMNNPVMYTDPWGLAPGDLIEDSLDELSELQISNIRSAQEARERGYIHAEEFARNVILNGGEVERFPGVIVEEKNNVITVTAYISFSETSIIPNKFESSFGEYKAAIIDSISEQWSGQYGNKYIETKLVLEQEDGIYNTINIDMIKGYGTSTGGVLANKNISLYFGYNGIVYSVQELARIAAHEFGHAAFGLPDVYKWPEMRKTLVSIMNNRFKCGVQQVDLAMMSASTVFKGTSIYDNRSMKEIANSYLR